MRTIQPTEILAYYDGVEVFAAQDSIGGHYVGAFVDAAGDADRYLVVGVRPARLRELRAGMLDLRTLLLESPGGGWYLTLVNDNAGQPLTLEPQAGPLAATDYLPEPGFLLAGDARVEDADLRQALANGKVADLSGKLEWADRRSGDWGLLTAGGVKSGKAVAGGSALDGLQIGKSYRFRCAVIDESDEFWRDRQAFYLAGFESI